MGGQHGIGSRNFDSETPPFLPESASVFYTGTNEHLTLVYPVNISPHAPDKTDFTVKGNGIPHPIKDCYQSAPNQITIIGDDIDPWANPVTLDYDGSNPDFKSVSGQPAAAFTNYPVNRSF